MEEADRGHKRKEVRNRARLSSLYGIEGRNKYRSDCWGGRACDGNAESLMFSFGCPYFYTHRTIPYL